MKHCRTMLWFFQAGLVAARRQLLSVLIMTSLLGLLAKFGLATPLLVSSGAGRFEVSPALTWSYLLLAANSAILPNSLIESTAARIRLTARRLSPRNPYLAVEELCSMLWLSAIADGVLVVATPPTIVLIISGYFQCIAVGAIGWAALMSVGAAFFGANGLAARKLL